MAQLTDGRVDILSRDDGKMLSQFSEGHSQTVLLNQPSVVRIHGTRAMVVEYQRQGNDLILHMRDGSTVRYQQFFTDDVDGDHSELVFDDGVAPPEHVLFPVTSEFADAQTAMVMTPEYESLGNLNGLMLAGIGADTGVMTAAGIGVLGLGGLAVGASGGHGGGKSSSGGGGGGGENPLIPTLTLAPFTGDNVLSQNEKQNAQLLTGTTTNAEAGSIVTITLNGKTYTTTVQADGSWSISIPAADLAALTTGNHTIGVSVTNAEGNTASGSETLNVEAGSVTPDQPTLSLLPFTGDNVLSPGEKTSAQTLSGTTTNAEAGSVVTVTLNGKTYTTTVQADGSWSLSLPAADLAALPLGSNSINASVTNGSGVVASGSENLTVESGNTTTPTVSILTFAGNDVLDSSEVNSSQTISGLTTGVEAGQVVSVTLNGKTYTATVQANGSWQVAVPASDLAALAQGNSTISASVSNQAGSSVSAQHNFVVDSQGSSITIDAISNDGFLNAVESHSPLTISGESRGLATGTVIRIALFGRFYSATVGSDGHWTTTIPAADLESLPNGQFLVTATATLPDGTPVSNGAPVDLNVITHPTLNPTVNPPFGDGVLNSGKASTDQTLTGNTGVTGPNQTVSVQVGGNTYTGTVNSDGSWSITLPGSVLQQLPQGQNALPVTVTDPAGNSSSTNANVNVSTELPTVTVTNPPENINGQQSGEALTLSGTTSSSDGTVSVTLGGVTYTATVSNGSWTVSVPASALQQLSQGDNTLTVNATDSHGNSNSTTSTINVDTTPPNLSIDPVAGDGYVNSGELAGNLAISGTAEPGSTITVRLDGVDLTARADATTGQWSVALSDDQKQQIADGQYTLTVTATDAAGNSTVAYSNVTFIAKPADLPTITVNSLTADNSINDAEKLSDQRLTGRTTHVQAGQEVTVTIGSETFTGTVLADGRWSVIIPSSLLSTLQDGTQAYSVKVSDVAGNAANTTGDFAVTSSSNGSLAIGVVSGDNWINATEAQSGVTVSGSSANLPAGTALTVTFAGQTYSATVGSDGSWSTTLPAAALDAINNGTYTLSVTTGGSNPVTSTISVGVRTDFPDNLQTQAPFGDNILNASEAGTPQTLSGNTGVAFPDQQVTVTINGTTYNAQVDPATGAWSLSLLPQVLQNLPQGQSSIIVTVSDGAGNSVSQTVSVTISTTAPALAVSPLENNGTINADSQQQPLTLSGTAAAGSTVAVTVNDQTVRAVADSNGNWQVNVPAATLETLKDGSYDVTVKATDSAGNSTTQQIPLQLDTQPPALSVTPAGGDGNLNAAEHGQPLVLSGSSEPGSSISVALNGTTYTATAGNDGSWQVTIPQPAVGALPEGTTAYTVTATDAAGNSTTSQQSVNVVATTLPTITVTPFTGDGVIDGAEQSLSHPLTGTTTGVPAGSLVTVTLNGTSWQGHVQADGSWSVTIPASAYVALQNGEQQFSVSVSDAAGNPASATSGFTIDNSSASLAMETLSGDGLLSAQEAQSDLVIHGSSTGVTAGSIVTVAFNGNNYTATVNPDGSWSATIPAAALAGLSQGDLNVTASVTDSSGAALSSSSTLVVATDPGFNVTLQPPFGDGVLNSSESATTQTLTGSTGINGVGQQVTVTVDGTKYVGTVDAQGNWQVSLPAAVLQNMAQGSHSYSISVQDASGNSSTPLTGSFTVDTQSPALTLDSVGNNNALNASLVGDTLPIGGAGDNGDRITITLNNHTYTTTVGSNGSWQIDLPQADLAQLQEGNYRLTVTSTDSAGNSSSVDRTLAVDLNPPAVSLNPISQDNYLNAQEALQPLIVSGGGEPGAQINVQLGNLSYTATVDGNGQWSVQVPASALATLADARYDVTVTASDSAGNQNQASGSLTVDTTPPQIGIAQIAGDDVLNGAEQQVDQIISGTAPNVAAGTTLTVTLNGKTYTTTVQSGGEWHATIPAGDLAALSNVQYSLSASATDAAGNSTTVSRDFTVNTSASSLAFDPISGDGYLNAQEAQSPLVVTGSSTNVAAGSVVTLTFTSGTFTYSATATVDAQGKWTLSISPADLATFPEERLNVSATTTDSGGAALTSSGTLDVYVDRVPEPTLQTPFTDGTLDNSEAAVAQILRGTTGESGDGQRVTVTLGGVSYEATVNSSGVWTLELTPAQLQALPQGENTLTVVATDVAGNSTTITPAPVVNVATTLPVFSIDPLAGGDNIINASEHGQALAVTGSGTAGEAVNVVLNGQSYTTTIGEDGRWSVNVPASAVGALNDGNYTLVVSVTDSNGNSSSQSSSLKVDTAPPAALAVNPVTGDDIINAAEDGQDFSVNGRAPAGSTLTVVFHGQTLTTTADENGAWSVTIPGSALNGLADGSYNIAVTATLANGNSLTSDHPITLSTAAPVLAIATIAGDGVINASEHSAALSMSGTGHAGDAIRVTLNGQVYQTQVDSNGNWSVQLPAQDVAALSNGNSYTASVTATDAAGNSTTQTSGVLVNTTAPALSTAPVAGDNVINSAEQQQPLTVSGSGEAGASIRVDFHGNTYQATVGSNGQWSLDIPASDLATLTNGSYPLVVTETNAAGNVSSSQITVSAQLNGSALPSVSLDAFAGNNVLDGAEQRVDQVLSGSTQNVEAGERVYVNLNGNVYSGVVQADGSWQVTVPDSALNTLTDGTQSFTVTVGNAAGNIANASANFTVNTDLSALSVAPVAGDGYLNKDEATNTLTINGSSSNIPENSSVTVRLGGTDYTATVGADGSWSVNVPASALGSLPQGSNTITVTSTDAAGNPVSSESSLVVATNVNFDVSSNAAFGDGILNGSEAGAAQTLSGNTGVTGAGQTVSLVLGGTTYTGTVDASGNWQVSLPASALQALTQGDNSAAVTVSDRAGNVGTGSVSFSVDTIAPPVTVNTVAQDGIINAAEQAAGVTLSGTGERGDQLTIQLGSATYNVQVGNDGTWQLPVSGTALGALADGRYTLTVTAQDAAGNTSTTSTAVTVKAAAADLPTISINTFAGNNVLDGAEQQTAQTLSGSTTHVEAGQTVTITLNGQVYNALVQASGAWSVQVPASDLAALQNGTATIGVAVSDQAGNPVRGSLDVTVNNNASGISVDPISGDGYINASEAGQPLTITGHSVNVAANSTVTLTFNNQNYTAQVGADGNWRVIIPSSALAGIPDGAVAVNYSTTDAAGNTVSGVSSVQLQVHNLPQASVDAPFSDSVLNGNEAATTQALTGRTGVSGDGQQASVVINGTTYTGTVDASGNWRIELPSAVLQQLPQGANSLPVTVSDAAGNTSQVNAAFNVDTVAPTITLNPVAGDGVVNGSEAQGPITISGTTSGAESGQTVTVTLNGQNYTTTVDAQGGWSLNLPAGLLAAVANGSYTLTASVADAAGNSSSINTPVTVSTTPLQPTIATPFGDGYLNNSEEQGAQTLSGTTGVTGAGQTVIVTLGGTDYTATVNAQGGWTLSVPAATLQALGQGGQTIVVTATDAQGNQGTVTNTFTVDSVAPTLSLNPVAGDNIINAAESLQPQSISGTASVADAGRPVVITLNGVTYQTLVQSDGSWNLSLPAQVVQSLADGTYPVTVSLTDAAGNTTNTSFNLTLDASPADLPQLTIGAVSTDNYVNQTEHGQPLTLSGTTVNVAAGQVVTLTLNGQTYTATVQANGSWSTTVPAAAVTALADGAQTVTASVTDTSGNPASSTHQFTVIAQGADLPAITINTIAGDDVINASENNRDLTVTGSSQHIPAGQTIQVTMNGKSYQATVASDGTWSATVPAADVRAMPQGDATATATGNDVAGNVANASHGYNVDTNPPILSATLELGGDGILNLAESLLGLVVGGNSEAGLTLSVTLNGKTYTTTVGENGSWSLTIPSGDLQLLPDGAASVGVSVTDTHGNTTSQVLGMNVEIHALPLLTLATPFVDGLLNMTEAAAAQVLSGTATNLAIGTAVTVRIGSLSFNGTVDAQGHWSANIPANALSVLGSGTAQITVTAVDAGGNPASVSSTVGLLLNAPVPTIATPFVDGALNAAEATANQLIHGATGITGSGQQVTLTLDGTAVTATVDAQGNWSATLTPAQLSVLSNGSHALAVTVTDAAGNSANTSLNFNAVVSGLPQPTLATLPFGAVLNAAEAAAGQTLSGTTGGITNAQSVVVTLNGTQYTATVNGGNWSLNLTPAELQGLPDGTLPVTVTLTDSVGNVTTVNSSFGVAVQTLPLVSINQPFGDGQLNLSESQVAQVLSGSTGISSAGQTVTVTIDGGTPLTATVSATGNWTLNLTPAQLGALSNGSHQVVVTATDSAGNSNAANLSFNAQLANPVPTLTGTLFGDGHLNISEAGGALTLTGKTGATGSNQAVKITVDVNGIAYNGTVAADGSWTVNLPAGALNSLSNGNHALNVTVTDSAGNTGTQNFNFDAYLTAPAPTLNTPFGDGFLNRAEATAGASLSGTTGTTLNVAGVVVTIGGVNYNAVVDNTAHTWSLALPSTALGLLAQGNAAISVVATDTGGNSTTISGSAMVDTIAPTVTINPLTGDNALSYLESHATQVLSGSTEAANVGDTVRVTIGSSTITTLVQADGSWSVNLTPTQMLSLGTGGSISASIQDTAGNTGQGSITVSVDTTPPATPLVTLGAISGDNIINASDPATLTLTGTYANLPITGGTVTVTVGGVTLGTPSIVTGSNGTWTVAIPNTAVNLPAGTDTVVVTLTGVGVNTTTSTQVLVDRTPPTLTIGAFAGNDVLNATEASAGQTLSGTASVSEAGRVVSITLNGKSYSALVQANGSWSTTVPAGDLQALAQGNQSISATLSDAAGNSTSVNHAFTVDTVAPLLQLNVLAGDNILNAAEVLAGTVLTGKATGAEGQTINLYLGDGNPIATATVGSDGTFSFNLTPQVLSSLNDGSLVFGVRVSDAAGNATDATLTVNKVVNSALNLVVNSIFGDGFLSAADATVAQTVSGVATSAGVGATVAVTLGGQTFTSTVGQDGKWAVVVPPSLLQTLSDGTVALNVTLTDAAGNSRTLPETAQAIIKNLPTIGTLDSLFGGDNLLNIAESKLGQTVSGTVNAATGSTVTVSLGSKSYQATVAAGGKWSVNLPAADLTSLTDGTLALGVTVVDPAGNTASSSLNVGIFTQQPTITLSPIFGDGILNVADALTGQLISGTVNNVAAGTVINLTVGGNSIATATVGANGAFSTTLTPTQLQGLANGNLTVGASLTDAAGNTASTTAGLVVKLTAPAITINPLFGDGLLNATDATLNQLIGGTISGVDAGSTVTITVGGQKFTTLTTAGGAFSLTLTPTQLQGLADGNLTVGVSVTDSAGNTSSANLGAVVGIHTLPTLSLNTIFGDGVLNVLDLLTVQTITGKATGVASGSTVTINIGSSKVTATVGTDGTFTAQVQPAILQTLLDGNLTVGASVSDTVGNVVSASAGLVVGSHTAPTITLNTVFGDGVLSAADLLTTQTISGATTNATSGSLVSVTLNGKTYTTTVGSNGGWALSVPKADLSALNNGNLTVNATVTDSYGNTASGNGALSVIAKTPPVITIGTMFGDNLLNAVEAQSAQTISGTATNAEGSTITVSLGGKSYTAVVGSTGAWSVSVPALSLQALADGSQTVSATLTNGAGTVGNGSASVVVGTHTLPTISLTTPLFGDNYLNLAEANKAETISGTSTNAVGDTVQVNVGGTLYTTTVGSNGAWSVSVPSAALKGISDGSQTVTVSVSDAVGNTASTSGSFNAVTHNLPALGVDPVLSLVSVLLTGLTISGGSLNLAQGSKVNVTLNGTTQQATIDALGRYSVKFAGGLLTAISLNSIVTVTAVDAAGNPASTSTTLLLGSLLPVATTATASALMATVDDSAVAATTSTDTSSSSSNTVHTVAKLAVHAAAATDTTTTHAATESDTTTTAQHSTTSTVAATEGTAASATESSGYTIGGAVLVDAEGHISSGSSVTGTSGDDTITLKSLDFSHIDGGSGHDTLVLGGEHMTLDLTSLGLKIEHIDTIDLGSSGNNSLVLNLNEAMNITDKPQDDLMIKGTQGDQVTLANADNGTWANVGQRMVEGQTFDVYHNSSLASDNTLGDVLVQHNLTVHVV